MDGLFDSAWVKWARGVRHAKALKRSVDAYMAELHGKGLGALWREYDAKHHCVIVRLDATSIPPPPPILSVQLGDVLHNYRSCLDHLSWALVSRGRTPPSVLGKKARKVYFPIYSDRRQFNGALAEKLPGVLRPDIAKVRAAQPYRAPKGARMRPYHYLSILNLLSNSDKHQRVEPVFTLPSDGAVQVLAVQDCTFTRLPKKARRYALEPDAEVCRVYVRRTGPNPDVDVHVAITPTPAIYEYVKLDLWLDTSALYISDLLRSFADPPAWLTKEFFDME